MNRLVLHHTYRNGSTFDLSRNGNHGRPESVRAAVVDGVDCYLFDDQASGILVRPGPALTMPLWSVRARCRLWFDGRSDDRLNLIEGFVSFALFIDGRRLTGTVVDEQGRWTGVRSDVEVPTDRWVE